MSSATKDLVATTRRYGEIDRRPLSSPQPSDRAGTLVQLLLLAVASVLVLSSLERIDPDRFGALGLIEQLPTDYWIGMGVLWFGFGLAVAAARPRSWVLAAYVVGLAVALTVVPAVVHEHPRFPTAWMHVGFADHIVGTGQIQTTLDARFNWPGGFVLIAFVTDALGVETARALLRWAPTLINVVLIAPLYSIAGSVTENVRARWLGVWFAIACLWVGQDYLAPQAYAFVVYLTIVGALLRRGHGRGSTGGWDLVGRLQRWKPALVRSEELGDTVPRATVERNAPLTYLLLMLAASVVVSHQLTPFLLIGALVVLLFTGHFLRGSFVVALAVLTVTWIMVGASDFLAGHLEDLVGEIGGFGDAVGGGVTERLAPDADRQLVLNTRVAFTVAVAAVGMAGFVSAWVRRRADWALLGLAVFPIGLLALSSYGGEGVLRVALFTTPFLVLLAVVGFTPAAVRRGWLWVGAVAVLGAAIVPAYHLARFGNEAFEVIRTEDLRLWETAATVASEGDIVMVPNFAGPWRHTRLTDLEYRVLVDELGAPPDADGVVEVLQGRDGYLLLGVSGQIYEQYSNGRPADWAQQLELELVGRPGWSVAFRQGRAVLLQHSAELAETQKVAIEAGTEPSAGMGPPAPATIELLPPPDQLPPPVSVELDESPGGNGG